MALALALSLGLNVLLGILVIRPKDNAVSHSMSAGARFPSFTLHDISGKEVKMTWPASDSRLTVVYLFTPTCSWCRRNIENFKALGTAEQSEYRLLPISFTRGGLAKYVETYGLAFPVYADSVAQPGEAFIYSGTPETLVVAPNGTVKRVWRGAFTEAVKKEVEVYLGVHLPGMIS